MSVVIKKVFTFALLLIGSFLVMAGLALATLYINGAIIARWGESDQSLLFWHLPILFIGIVSLAAGLALSLWGIKRFKSELKRNQYDDKTI